jgi:hypothetical protein
MSKQFSFFATVADLSTVLRLTESLRPLRYTPAGVFDSKENQSFPSFLEIERFCVSKVGDYTKENKFLVSDKDEKITARKVIQIKGNTKFSFDQKENPQTIVLAPGGLFENQYLIQGNVGTVSEDKKSLAIFKLFEKNIKRHFKKIKSFYVGKEAEDLLNNGMRLTANIKSPEIYDLKK